MNKVHPNTTDNRDMTSESKKTDRKLPIISASDLCAASKNGRLIQGPRFILNPDKDDSGYVYPFDRSVTLRPTNWQSLTSRITSLVSGQARESDYHCLADQDTVFWASQYYEMISETQHPTQESRIDMLQSVLDKTIMEIGFPESLGAETIGFDELGSVIHLDKLQWKSEGTKADGSVLDKKGQPPSVKDAPGVVGSQV
ncbi:MAG: hypothetical protein TREMPRED_004426 [Tremellales sp. Tagirdzhanova-0007]|nr:MAG: hypothetical protein TREMPRED_004426 [Tremellales sp. Tagirdzhanova-0007]